VILLFSLNTVAGMTGVGHHTDLSLIEIGVSKHDQVAMVTAMSHWILDDSFLFM
jgi:hypothetical protein